MGVVGGKGEWYGLAPHYSQQLCHCHLGVDTYKSTHCLIESNVFISALFNDSLTTVPHLCA